MQTLIKHNFLKLTTTAVLFWIVVFSSHQIKAQAPGASCAAAVFIGGAGAIPGCTGPMSITDFATDGAAPSCLTGAYRRDGWFKFVNPSLQNITISGTSSSPASSNLIIQVLSACGTEVPSGCANAVPTNGAQTETLMLNLAAGTYLIKVTNYSTSTGATMVMSNLCVGPTPANNDCANAVLLTPSAATLACSPTAGNTYGATQQATVPPNCIFGNASNNDVWYTFSAIANYQFISVIPTASMDAVFEVFSSNPCGGAGTSMGCFNQGPSSLDTTTLGTTNGATYWIRVFDAGPGINSSLDFGICIQTPPVNDACISAIPLSISTLCSPTSGDVNVGTDSQEPIAGGGCASSTPNDDVWYSFVATNTSQTVTVTGSASFDPVFEVFSGTCAGLTSVLCFTNAGNPGGTISSVVTTSPGATYYVRVYDYNPAYPATTTFSICITNPAPANDNCSGVISLTPSTLCNPTTGNVSGASQSLVAVCGGNANDDVWYSFTTTATVGQAYVVTVVGTASFDAAFQVYSLSCGGTSINCTNANGTLGGTETTTLLGLNINSTYWVRVYDTGAGYPATSTFTICITMPPSNNDCPGPTLFVWGTTAAPAYCGGTTAGTISGATASGQIATCGGLPNNDVWYNFVATSATNIVTVVPCGTMNVVVQGYSASCGGTSIGCANLLGAGGTETLTLSGLTSGTTYWVRVYDFTGTSACNTFSICVATPPVNDPCASAIALTPSTTCTLTSGTVNGGTQSLVANCGGTVTSDVWYTFTAGAANQTITVNGAAGINIVYELFSTSPCAGAGTSLGCINNTGIGGNETFAWTGLTGGATYWIRVYDFSGAPTSFAFAICVVTPSNDLCANATTAVCGGVYTGCTTVACGITGTGDPTALCVAATAPAQGVWYILAGTGQNVVLSTCGVATNYDTQLFVYTGTCGSLTCVTGNDDMCNPGCVGGITCAYIQASRVTFATVVGTNYYIFVSGWSGGTGNFTLTVTCVTPPVNDLCSGAITLDCQGNPTTYTGSTITASSSGDITLCSAFNAMPPLAVWYYYPGDGSNLTLALCGGTTNFDTQIGVWAATSCAGPFSCVAGNDNVGGCTGSAAGNASSVSFFTSAGTNYYIEVSGVSGTVGNGTQSGNFTLNVSGSPCLPLPISLLSFTGQAQGTRNRLDWATATETNNDYFTIERANDGFSFMTLTKINGAGNSTSTLNYHTFDEQPENGITYYRLKQTDYNGSYTYSSIITVDNVLQGAALFNIHPNPTTNDINFDFYSTTKGNIHVQILDYLGRIMEDEIQSVQNGSSAITSKMNTLAPGVYSLKVSFDQTGFVSVTKVVKN